MIPFAQLGPDAATGRFGLGGASELRAGAADERLFRFELAAHPGSVARARRLTRVQLAGWAVCEETCDTAALVVSELVTNAIVHTAGEHVVCELHDEDDMVRIAVRDEGCAPGEPHPVSQRPEEEHGRGLLLVAALCRAWGAQETGAGLLVWAELAREGDQPAPAEHPCPSQPSRDLSCSGDRSRALEEATARPERGRKDTAARLEPCRKDTAPVAPHEFGWKGTAARPELGRMDTAARSGWDRKDTAARSDLGWSAKRPPADSRDSGAKASRGTGTAWV